MAPAVVSGGQCLINGVAEDGDDAVSLKQKASDGRQNLYD